MFTNLVTPGGIEQRTLKVYIIVNGYQAKGLYNTYIMEDNPIIGKFVSINQIVTKNHKIQISLKMGRKGLRSTTNY
jgi:hypothetical protein